MTAEARGVAFVTGAGRGIGRAVAVMLARRGFDVALVARTMEELERTAALVATEGGKHAILAADVSQRDRVEWAAENCVVKLGVPTVVVCCAGIVRRAPVHKMTDEDWDAVMDVNLKGTFLVARALLPPMLRARRGRIIHISSISATLGTASQAAYAASKWGLLGFTKSLAEELRGTGLQTMAVLPGSVDTTMLVGSGYTPQMTAEDVAGVVAYAALDAPDAMNGSSMEVFGP